MIYSKILNKSNTPLDATPLSSYHLYCSVSFFVTYILVWSISSAPIHFNLPQSSVQPLGPWKVLVLFPANQSLPLCQIQYALLWVHLVRIPHAWLFPPGNPTPLCCAATFSWSFPSPPAVMAPPSARPLNMAGPRAQMLALFSLPPALDVTSRLQSPKCASLAWSTHWGLELPTDHRRLTQTEHHDPSSCLFLPSLPISVHGTTVNSAA